MRKVIAWALTDLQYVRSDSTTMFAAYSQVAYSVVGKRTSIGRYSKVTHSDIGAYCSISWDVTINAVSHNASLLSTNSFSRRPDLGGFVSEDSREYTKVEIGNDVWIGAQVIVMPGVCIGDGAIIGAGSIVTRDVKPYEVVVGSPAKHLKWRFNEDVIEGLLKLKWWDWSDELIRKNIRFFQADVTVALLQDIEDV